MQQQIAGSHTAQCQWAPSAQLPLSRSPRGRLSGDDSSCILGPAMLFDLDMDLLAICILRLCSNVQNMWRCQLCQHQVWDTVRSHQQWLCLKCWCQSSFGERLLGWTPTNAPHPCQIDTHTCNQPVDQMYRNWLWQESSVRQCTISDSFEDAMPITLAELLCRFETF